MSTKHTPGPWEWVGHDLESNSPGYLESVIETTVDCMSYCYGGCVKLKISDADARLIAAAPELFEALDELLREAVVLSADYLETFRDWPDDASIQGWGKARWKAALTASEKAKSALAKVRGAA